MEREVTIIHWSGTPNRLLEALRPCPCGCDERDGPIAGYLTGSDSNGEGFSIMIPDEDSFALISSVLQT